MLTADFLDRLARAVLDINAWDLEEAGVIADRPEGEQDWMRFNRDVMTFILKLPPDRLERFAALLTKMTERQV